MVSPSQINVKKILLLVVEENFYISVHLSWMLAD